MTNKYKYPRTPHLPWSPGATSDDRMLDSVDHFVGKEVVVTIKMDGENTTLYSDGLHARSIEGAHHSSQDWVRALQSKIGYNIPSGWRICGENLFAKHSIGYINLPSYFLVFSIWDENNVALSWADTITWANLLELNLVPELYRGIWDEEIIRDLYHPSISGNEMEGYVVRVVESFAYDGFSKSIAKYVRKNHVTTDNHWKYSSIIPNKLIG